MPFFLRNYKILQNIHFNASNKNKFSVLLKQPIKELIITQYIKFPKASPMKALMLNSTSGNLINEIMRDQRYVRHLRQVEKINNRQADNIRRTIDNYKSINNLHHKHKSYAFQWHYKEVKCNIQQKNKRIKQKISQIRPYFQSPNHKKKSNQQQQTSPLRLTTLQTQNKNLQQTNSFKKVNTKIQNNANYLRKSQQDITKTHISLNNSYMKRRQQQIDKENIRMIKAIQSLRGTSFPKLYLSRQKQSINQLQSSPKALKT